MNQPFVRPVALAGAWLIGLGCSCLQAQPAAPSGAQPQQPSSSGQQSAVTEQRRQALELLGEAELALEAGQKARALQLAQRARKLYPQSKAIAGFLAAVKAPAASRSTAAYTRAKAHLAAALSRAQILMDQRRYTESLDLLNGIIEASKKLPEAAGATIYRDLARKELAKYRAGVESGAIRPSMEVLPGQVTLPSDLSPTPPPFPEFPAAPTNAYRLARLAKRQVPEWYTRIKTALRRTMTVDYRAMPLGLVLDEIEQATGVKIIIDTPVQAARTTLTAVVDLRVSAIPAETVLNLATEIAGCEYVLLDKGVVITTRDKAGDYIKNLPDIVANHWAAARFLFPDLYREAMKRRPLPEVKPGQAVSAAEAEKRANVPLYLRSGKELVADIERLLQ